MFSFFWELMGRAWNLFVAAVGTTTLGFTVGLVFLPVILHLLKVWRGKATMKPQSFIETAIGVLAVYGVIYFAMLIFGVPREIRTEANNQRCRIHVPAPPVDSRWDEDYRHRQKHLAFERKAIIEGRITEERKEQIRGVLASNIAERFQVFFVTVGSIPSRQLELLRGAFKEAGWPEPKLAGATGFSSVMMLGNGAPAPIKDHLYVVAIDPHSKTRDRTLQGSLSALL